MADVSNRSACIIKKSASKCNIMKRTSKIEASYTLESTDLEIVDSIKYLGVTITHDLRWNTRICDMCTKGNRTLGFMRWNLYQCPQDVKEAAYTGIRDLFAFFFFFFFWVWQVCLGSLWRVSSTRNRKKIRIGLLCLLLAITVLKLGVWQEYWQKLKWGLQNGCLTMVSFYYYKIRIRIFTGGTFNDIHSPGPVIWELSP